MADQNIGAARVHLVVDATDWDSTLAQARNAAAQFGTDAERAFEKSEGSVRRAATRLLDYAASLGRVDTQMERYIRNASRAGVDEPIIRAAIARWEEYQKEVVATTAALEEAARINKAFDQARAQAAQQGFNKLLGVDDTTAEQRARRQADARAALTEIIEKEIAAEQKLQATRQQGEQFLSYLKNLHDTAGKTHYEILELKAAQLGLSAEAGPLIQAIKQQNEAMGAGTLSAKQYEWAMRGLPAQLTDITVGLATGQKPMMVFLQQGGQLKDMFGGIVPAAKAVGGAILGMINPLTIGAAAAAALGYAWWKMGEDGREANENIRELADGVGDISRMGLFAKSEGEVRRFANALAEVYDIKPGRLTELMSGLDFQDQSAAAAEMYAQMTKLVGKSDELREKYQDMANAMLSNVSASAEQLYILGYITREQRDLAIGLEDINALEDARRIIVEGINESLAEQVRFQDLKYPSLIKEQDILDRIQSNNEQIERVRMRGTHTNMLRLQQLLEENEALREQLGVVQDIERARAGAESGREQRQAEARMEALEEARDKVRLRYGTLAQQREIELEQAAENYRKQLLAARSDEERRIIEQTRDEELAGIKRVYDEREKRERERGRRRGYGRDGTAAIRDAAQAEIAAITTQTRLLQQQYDQRAITVEDYYDRLHAFADEELAVTLRSIEAQKAALAGREDSAQRIEQLESQAARAREQHIQREIELDEQRRRAVQQREIAFRDYVRSLDDANEAAQRDADLAVARITMGAKEYERMVALNDLLRHRKELEEELDRRVADGNLNPEDALRYRDALERVNEQVHILTEGWDRVDKAQASALNGMSSAWENWLAQTRDVAAQWSDIFTNAISGLSDGIADMLAANEQDWDAYFQNLHTMILRFIVQQQLTKFIESIMGGGSNGWGNIFSLFGSKDSFTGFAHGGTPGGAGLSAYRNSIVSQPTFFPFARGGVPNIGLMGERSGKPHEAIMPLTRTSSGDLGVRVVESNQRGPTYINQQFVVQGTPDRSTREHMAKKAGREISRAMSRT